MNALATFFVGIGKWLLQFFFAVDYGKTKEREQNKDIIIEDARKFEENRKRVEHMPDDELDKWV